MAGKNSGGRLAYADLLRVFAMLAVVVLHLAGSHMADVGVNTAAWGIFNLYDGAVRWCVPVFVMCSGMFMLDPGRGLPLSKLFFHHILRLFAALVFWEFLYAFFVALLSGQLYFANLGNLCYNVLLGYSHYHLWFIPMMMGLYLVTPVLRAFVRGASRGDFHWFFLLVFLFAMLFPTLLALRPSQTLATYVNRLQIHLVLGYVGYYVAGYYLKHYTLGRVAEFTIYALGIVGGIVTVWGTGVLSRSAGGFVDTLYGYLTPNVAAMAVAVFVLFRYVLGISEERSRRQRVGYLGRITFGIYLCHDIFIQLLSHFGITTLTFLHPAVAVPVLSLIVFLCAMAVAWLISKIPFVGRYLT